MEFIKIFLLFSISIACSLSQQPEETQAVAEPEIDLKISQPDKSKTNCNGRYCRRNMGRVTSEQQCICFPLNSDNTLVPQYITNDPQDQLTRTVIYIYTIGNKSSIYIPSLLKQSFYTDPTFDVGDVLRPLSSHNVNILTAKEYSPYPQFSKEKIEDHTRRSNNLESGNQPIVIQNLEKLNLPSTSDDINQEALKHVLEDDLNVSVPKKLPNSQRGFGQNGATNPQNIDKPQSVFEFYPDANPKPVIVSKPGVKTIPVHDTDGSQKDFYPNGKKIYMPHIDKELTDFEPDENGYVLSPNGNELYSQQLNKPKNIGVPYATAGSNFGNIVLKPNEKRKDFPLKEFQLNVDYGQLHAKPQEDLELKPISQDTISLKGMELNFDYDQLHAKPQDDLELKPISQDKAIYNIDRPVVVAGLNPSNNYLHLHHFDRPIKGIKSNPTIKKNQNLYDNDRHDLNFGLSYDKDYLPLHADPQIVLGSNLNENDILVDNIAKPEAIFGVTPNELSTNLQPIVEPQKQFGIGSLMDNIPKPLKDLGSTLYLNNIAQPQRKIESEIDEDDPVSTSFFKPQPNIKCSSGICKLYIYCSKNDCPKYLQSLAKLHTSIHKHPQLENTFVAIHNARTNVNNTESDLKPFSNFIILEDANKTVQDIHSFQLGDLNPSLNHYGHLLSQQVSRSIPIGFNPLSSISDQEQTIQNLLPSSQIQEHRVEYYPRKNKVLSTHYRNSPYNRDLSVPRQHTNNHYYRRTGALTSDSKHNFIKDLFLLPSQVHRTGKKAINDLVSNLSLRRNNLDDEEGVSEEVKIPVDEDDVKIKIIGGQPAVSSGTPMQIKARLSDVV